MSVDLITLALAKKGSSGGGDESGDEILVVKAWSNNGIHFDKTHSEIEQFLVDHNFDPNKVILEYFNIISGSATSANAVPDMPNYHFDESARCYRISHLSSFFPYYPGKPKTIAFDATYTGLDSSGTKYLYYDRISTHPFAGIQRNKDKIAIIG